MRRLRHTVTGIQILVTDEKAARIISQGSYAAVPEDEQPPKDTAPQEQATTANSKPGHTSIAAALKAAVGPTWNMPL